MASNVTSAVAPQASEYNLVDSQESSEKTCCPKVKEAVCGVFKAIGDFFKKVISFFKEHCCCGKKPEEIAEQTETSSMEGKTEGKIEAKPKEIQKEEEFTEEELDTFGKELNAYFSDENMTACLAEEGLSIEDLETLPEEQQYEFREKMIERLIDNFLASKGGKPLSLSEDGKKLVKELASLTIKMETEEVCKEEEEKFIRQFNSYLICLCK